MLDTSIQHYYIQSVLGKGGMATVYLAEDQKFKSLVALKILNKEYVHNDHIRKRFLEEARNMFRMSHPNIVKVTDLIDEHDIVAFAMEHIEGQTLREYNDTVGKLTDNEIERLMKQMLEALHYVHQEQLIHRDIKPSNFMVDKRGAIKLMDFGIAKNTDASAAEYTQTGTGMTMGTPMYMSPEQITETKSVTVQSDVYSLGVVLWQLVTGKRPYDTQTLSNFQLQMKIVQEDLPTTGTSWDSMIQQATRKDPERRFISCTEFLEALNGEKEVKLEQAITYPEQDQTIVIHTVQEPVKPLVPEQHFPTVVIGSQVWMTKNLQINHFRNGDLIPEAITAEEWMKADQDGKPAWCHYDNKSIQPDAENGSKYGKLYNWHAVNDPRGLAPQGWHIPTDAEWTVLIDALGGVKSALKQLKAASSWIKKGWWSNGNGSNESGFSALPGGIRSDQGAFLGIGERGYWWSATELGAFFAWYRSLGFGDDPVKRDYHGKGNGFSVRCLKDD
jgi:uncharacterized protein (TIGR02145 family)